MSAVPSASASSDAAAADRNETASSQGQGQGQGQSQSQDGGRGEGSSGAGNEQRRASTSRTLADVMREPSTTTPGVMVLDSLPETTGRKDVLDPKEDLWLSTVDGRYSSPIIPLRVGEAPYHETFYVHKHVLLKSEYFEKALCGEFKESGMQSIDLPEENPAIFHFLVAYLYEGKYEPIRPAASVLVPDQDKGKGNAVDTGGGSDSESASSIESDVSARSRRRRDRHRRREDRNWERMRQKHPGMHRPNCNCPQCTAASGPPCWSCRAPRNPPPYYHPPHTVYVHDGRPERQPRRPPRRRHHAPGIPPPPPPLTPPLPATPGGGGGDPAGTGTNTGGGGGASAWPDPNGGRISGEDLRTWLLAYELHMDVYIVANKFLLEGFKKEVARAAVDMLETAGSDAAVAEVLFLCRKLYDGLPESDPLLKMVFARVGFLQPWRRAEREAADFLAANPEIAPLLLREMAARREDDVNGRALPSMVRPWYAFGGGGGPGGGGGGGLGGGNGGFGGPGGPIEVFPPNGYRGWPAAPGPGPGHHPRRY